MSTGKRFYIVIAIVVMLLLALIATQIYWVRSTSRLRQIDRKEKITAALHKTIEHTESFTHSFYLYSRIYIQPGQGVSIVKKDGNSIIDTLKLFNAFPYYNKPDTCFYTTNTSYYHSPVILNAALRFEYLTTDSLPDIQTKNKDLADLTFNNFRQRMDENAPVTKRLRLNRLDSLLKIQLDRASIHSTYTYGLKRHGQKSYEYIADSLLAFSKHIEVFSVPIFDDMAYTTPYDFVLFIKNEENSLNSFLTGALGISSFIILLLAAAFIYFAYTVLHQKRLSQMKTDFINNMTHEFMTPVTNIALALETLDKTQTDNDRKKVLHVIGSENTHLKDNINKVLRVAVLEKNSILLDPVTVDIHELIHRVIQGFSLQLEKCEGSVSFKLGAEDPNVIVDETHIINLFYNIIDNAIKYRSSTLLVITISSGTRNGKLWVSIADNGIGMSSSMLQHIFDRFYRGTTGDRHDVKGFGLGLNYVKHIADAHNMDIDVKSSIGKGTTFTISFN